MPLVLSRLFIQCRVLRTARLTGCRFLVAVEVLEMDTTVDAPARRQGPEGSSVARLGIPCDLFRANGPNELRSLHCKVEARNCDPSLRPRVAVFSAVTYTYTR